jgi:hypothetical protein
MDLNARRLTAMLLLSVIVVTGWFELLALTGQGIIANVVRVRQEPVPPAPPPAAEHCSPILHAALASCHQHQQTTCGKSCCKNGCRMGADCRCGSAKPRPRGDGGLLITAQGCHPLDGSLTGLIVPHSVTYRFLPGSTVELISSVSFSELLPVAFDGRPVDRSVLPETPPPKSIALSC